MKRWIISVPVEADISILDTVMSTVMPGSREYGGRILIDIVAHDDAFDPAVITGTSVIYDGTGKASAEILSHIDGPGIPHTWALIENPSIQQLEITT